MEESKMFLAETDEEFARKSAYVKMAPFYTKIIKAKHFLDAYRNSGRKRIQSV